MEGPLLRGHSKRLQPNILKVVRYPNANQSDPCNSVVQSVHFHPGSEPDRPLMLTAGLDKTLRFFQVGAEESVKVHGIHCKFSVTFLPLASLRRAPHAVLSRQSQSYQFIQRNLWENLARSWSVAADLFSTFMTPLPANSIIYLAFLVGRKSLGKRAWLPRTAEQLPFVVMMVMWFSMISTPKRLEPS